MSQSEELKNALELQGLVKEFFTTYLNRVEESDSGNIFNPIYVSCCRVMLVAPLGNLLERMRVLSGAEPNPVDTLRASDALSRTLGVDWSEELDKLNTKGESK